jgi:hypothetical protein
MSDDLIKRDDALNACVLREDNPPTEMQLSLRNVISALPAVPTRALAELETEPLGAEFEAVWDANKTELYEP